MDSTLQAGWLTAIATLLAALLGVAGTLVVQHWLMVRRERAAARADIYFKLMDLNGRYFWVASAQMRGEKPSRESLQECHTLAWQLTDQLRRYDSVEHLDEILLILFDESISTANERAKRLDAVINSYGALVNPAYVKAISRVSSSNLMSKDYAFPGAQQKSYPPGLPPLG
jgi:hypothetical protein